MSEPALLPLPNSAPVATNARRFTQLVLAAVTVACYLIFWQVSRMIGVPAEPRLGGSILQQPTFGGIVIGLLAAIALLVGCTLFASTLLDRRWIFGGIFSATAGLSAWAMRGGPMREVLIYASSTLVFAKMALELLILGGAVAGIWRWVWGRLARTTHRENAPPEASDAESPNDVLMAVAAQTVVMTVVMLLLAQTDVRKQAVASVLIAAVIGTGFAEAYFSSRNTAKWFWAGPVLVGTVGYLAALISNGGWQTGTRELAGPFAALARALPLDYASVGMCGALLGYGWMTPGEPDLDPSLPPKGI